MVSKNGPKHWPPGRPLIPQEVVADFKRERCAVALSEVVSEAGMGGLTVNALVKQARMARGTFYDLFGGLQNAARYAAELGCERLREAVEEGARGEGPWEDRLEAAITGLLETARQEPALAELCLVHTRGWMTGEDGRPCESELVEALAGLLDEPGNDKTRGPLALLAAYGVLSIIGQRLRGDDAKALDGLAGELIGIAKAQAGA